MFENEMELKLDSTTPGITNGHLNMKIYQMTGNRMFSYLGEQQMYLRQYFYIAHADIKTRSKYSVQK